MPTKKIDVMRQPFTVYIPVKPNSTESVLAAAGKVKAIEAYIIKELGLTPDTGEPRFIRITAPVPTEPEPEPKPAETATDDLDIPESLRRAQETAAPE